ncbi:MAG: hypothetical protein WCP10_15375 [Desulfuromonadales bacterium]
MSVNSITGTTVSYNVPSVNVSASEDKSAQSRGAKNESAVRDQKANAADAKVVDVVSSSVQKTSVAGAGGTQASDQVVRRVVESYNQQGKLRTKYLDSKNHVIYQLPSEMVARAEDQVTKSEASSKEKV